MSSLLIRGGRVLDPGSDRDEITDVLIGDGVIKAVGGEIAAEGIDVIAAHGLVVVPGFVDIHVHLREPGREDKETIATGTRAAAAGGFTTICPMPNTDPIDRLRLRRRTTSWRSPPAMAWSEFVPVAVGHARFARGESITEFGDLVNAGAVAFSDDGQPVCRAWHHAPRARIHIAMLGRPVLNHAELPALATETA